MTARDRTVLMIVGALAAVAAFWFLALSPKRQEAADLGGRIAAARGELQAAQDGARTAAADKERYASDYAMVARLGKAVPAEDEVPSLLVQLESAAKASRVDFRAIRVESRGAAPAAAATPAAAAAQVGNAEKDATATTPPAAVPASATESVAAALPPGATVGPAGFPTMPFSFTFEGGFRGLERFLDRIAAFTRIKGDEIKVRGRLLTIDGVGLTAGPKGFPQMRAEIAATAYLLPADQAVVPPPADATAPAPPPSSTAGETVTASTPRGKRAVTPTAVVRAGGAP